MLGRFLELSVTTPDIRASLSFYGRLGFSQAAVGEAWKHPYAAVTDGRVVIGLHQEPDFLPSLTFVRPGLLEHLPQFDALGLVLELRQLGGGVFNELGWRDPSGHLVRLVEARTFSPCERRPTLLSACGYFLEIALPAADRGSAKDYWERLGFVGMDEPHAGLPHVSLISDTIGIGLHDPSLVREPTLVFEADDVGATVAILGSAGAAVGRGHAALEAVRAKLVNAPEGTPILVTAASD